MEVRRRIHPIGGKQHWKTFQMYTIEEAKAQGISFTFWREISGREDIGKYFLSDDGWVSECLGYWKYKRKKTNSAHPDPFDVCIRLVCGRGWINVKAWGALKFKPPGEVYDWMVKDIKQKKLIARTAAEYIVRGQKIDLDQIGLLWRPNSKVWMKVNARRLLSTERMQEMIKEEVAKAAVGGPWTIRRVLSRYNSLYVQSRKEKPQFAKEILDKISSILDMEPDRQQVSTRMNFNMGGAQGSLLPGDADEMDAIAAAQEVKQISQ